MKKPAKRKPRSGWTFHKPVPAGANTKVLAFFKSKADAEYIAQRFGDVKVVACTLRLDSPKRKT